MPVYPNSSFSHPKLLTSDFPEYLIGGFNFDVAPGEFQITADGVASDVATLTGYLIAGNVPSVGDLISVEGTQNQSGAYNVGNVAISAVDIDATTGEGTISYALTNSNAASTADAGRAKIVAAESAESYTTGTYKSVAVVMMTNPPNANNSRTFTLVVTTPTNSSLSAKFTLEGAERDIEGQYSAVSPLGTTVTAVPMPTTAGDTVSAEYSLTNYRFLRIALFYTSGSATVTAKIQG